MLDFEIIVPRILGKRTLKQLTFYKEGANISDKLGERLYRNFYGKCIPCFKNADIVIAMDAITIAPFVDTIILFSGDQDYIDLVRRLKYLGKNVEIVSIKETTSNLLRNEVDANHYILRDDCFSLNNGKADSRNKEEAKLNTNS